MIGSSKAPFIITDIDGVLALSQQPMVDTLNAHCGTTYTLEDSLEFPFFFEEARRITGDPPEVVYEWLFGEDVMAAALPVPGAQEAVWDLVDAGFQFAAASNRPSWQRDVTLAWLDLYFPFLLKESDVYLKDIDTKGAPFKADIIQRYGAVAFAEDKGELLTGVAKILSPCLVCLGLLDRPWNSTISLNGVNPNARRLGNWAEGDTGWAEFVAWVCKTKIQ